MRVPCQIWNPVGSVPQWGWIQKQFAVIRVVSSIHGLDVTSIVIHIEAVWSGIEYRYENCVAIITVQQVDTSILGASAGVVDQELFTCQKKNKMPSQEKKEEI